MYLYTLKQHKRMRFVSVNVVNRFKKNVSLHVETTESAEESIEKLLWIALKKMYLYTLKQLQDMQDRRFLVVNRFKKNVSLHVETTIFVSTPSENGCESL